MYKSSATASTCLFIPKKNKKKGANILRFKGQIYSQGFLQVPKFSFISRVLYTQKT